MLRLSRPLPARRRETTIALINVVFLMLIFFLIAGTLTPPLDKDVDLIETATADPSDPPNALFVTQDGELRSQGRATDVAAFVSTLSAQTGEEEPLSVKLAADRELPATRLIEIVGELRQAGVTKVSIVTERATQ
ncbi:ExbD/TolR family protein [Nitratireductor thuwali]|uniref:Biopolymer transporter ExbD n=1 Tax=Nitratireductor thuwali TaxID=2267699 RepID=A0ABY5MD40_9HYPH|nr:hypothetical protein NTH_00419 [Nitratireductor thuwali]